MKSKYILGADLGTSGCKVIIIDDRGKNKGSAFLSYKTSFGNGLAEQNPDVWLNAFQQAAKKALRQAGISSKNIEVVGLDGMMNTLVVLDKTGKPLRPAILWMDQRSASLAVKLNQVLTQTNGPITATSLLAKLAWLADRERNVWKKTHYIMVPKDYVRYRLTKKVCTEPSDASATQLFNIKENTWSPDICDILNLTLSKLPPVVASHHVVGTIREGTLKGVPIIAGCSDAAADNLAVGVIQPGECLVRLGTCGALFLVEDSLPEFSKQYYILAHCIPDRWLKHSLTPAGLALEWFARTFQFGRYSDIDKTAKKAPIGSGRVFFYPYLLGEHTPRVGRSLSGCFVGIRVAHGQAHMARAVLEGVAFSIKECLETMTNMSSGLVKRLTVAGGGARSSFWLRILANALGFKLLVPRSLDASLGAAMLAGIGIGIFENVTEAVSRCVSFQEIIYFNHAAYRKYLSLFQEYLLTADSLWAR